MDEKRPYPYSQTLEEWEKGPQMGIEPVHIKTECFISINQAGPSRELSIESYFKIVF